MKRRTFVSSVAALLLPLPIFRTKRSPYRIECQLNRFFQCYNFYERDRLVGTYCIPTQTFATSINTDLLVGQIHRKVETIFPPPFVCRIKLDINDWSIFDWYDDNKGVLATYYCKVTPPNFLVKSFEEMDTPEQAAWRFHEIYQILNG